MKFLAYLKISLIQTVRESKQLFLVFAVFPIALGIMLAYFQKDLFTPSTDISRIPITITDEDNSKYSESLIVYLNSKSLQDIIEVIQDKKKAHCEILIPKGYEDKFLKERKNSINIKLNSNSSESSANILTKIINNYIEELDLQLLLKKNTSEETLVNSINKKLNEIYTTDTIYPILVNLKKNLDSFEYYSISLLGFMFMMLIISLSASFYIDKENGMYDRIMSTATTKAQYFNYNLATCLATAIFLNLVYVFTYRITSLSFKGPLGVLLSIILVQSILVTSVTGLFTAFFNKKVSSLVLTVLLFVQVIIGGGFIPLEKLGLSNSILMLSNFSPDSFLKNAYKNFLIYGNYSSVNNYIIIMLLFSVIIYFISITKIKLS